MSEENTKNPLDEMDDDAQSENGDASHSDANVEGGTADQQSDASDNDTDQSDDESLDDDEDDDSEQAPADANVSAPTQSEQRPPEPPTHVASRIAPAQTEADFGITYGKRKKEIAAVLQKQPKVAFMIPRDPMEAAGLAYETVQINGHRMEIKKGVMVTIPRQVAEILAEKYRVQLEAGAEKRIDRSEDVMDHLT